MAGCSAPAAAPARYVGPCPRTPAPPPGQIPRKHRPVRRFAAAAMATVTAASGDAAGSQECPTCQAPRYGARPGEEMVYPTGEELGPKGVIQVGGGMQ